MTDFGAIDYFTDPSLLPDPYPYLEFLRQQGPVVPLPHHGVVAVTGYDEALEVFRDSDTYSSCNSVTGPFPGLPVLASGDDISDLIERHRAGLPMAEYLIAQDPPVHALQRGILAKLFTPKRMKENEAFLWRLVDRQIDEFIGKGRFEVLGDFAKPFALLAIADLLGVPEEDHRAFRMRLGGQPGQVAADGGRGARVPVDPLAFLTETFSAYIEDRRREPREDVLTQVALATHADGTTPEVIDVVHATTFLFGAGTDTTTRLLSFALRYLAERPDLEDFVRADRRRVPNFVEETLRLESPVKNTFRMVRRSTSLAGVRIPAGTTMLISLAAANRDPRRFETPAEFRPERPNAREHLTFGRGVHACIGGPLARLEGCVSLERLLDRTADLRIDEACHGPERARHYDYEPTYILRGLQSLHLEFTPA